MDAKQQAEKLLKSWKDYLYNSGFNDKQTGYNAHEDIKKLVKESIVNKEVVKELCEQAGDFFFLTKVRIFDFLSEELKNDQETILSVLQAYGDNLSLLSLELQDDKEMVLAAVSSTDALKYASERLKDDDIVILLSLINDPETIEFASERLRNDRELSISLLKKHNYIFDKISINFRNDPIFISEFWDDLKINSLNQETLLASYIPRLVKNFGEDLKLFFKDLDLENDDKELFNKFEIYLNSAVLNKELNINNNSAKKIVKKI